jgi:hypothetical protein
MVLGQPGQKKFMGPHPNGRKLGMVEHICHPTDSRKLKKIGGSQSRLTWAKGKSYFQNNQSKKDWRNG